ncbi:hypothetical protein RI844_13705 [Thalassotalea fonticola]|uniref:Uncharacterized protein n=1 Tax=Thalassotalea fonticola TaxID=3065649 RepID=A0ABZ0GKX6_9GAMM|nr:hypothetical protein RI844_13705 [Colwelliaceae bacterium S1-1]
MSINPILESSFYHDGRGPEPQNVIWKTSGVIPEGFEYFNPDDDYVEPQIKHIKLIGVQAYAMATDEVHGNIVATGESNAAINEIVDSAWLKSFSPIHLSKCKHFQIMFYDEIYDIICEDIISGLGKIYT